MKRAAKILLTLGGTLSLVQTIIGQFLAGFFGFIFAYLGLGFSSAGISMTTSNASVNYGPTFLIAGVASLTAGFITVSAILVAATIYEFGAIFAFINVFTLDDKKAGYILSIVFGVFTLLGASFIIGLFIILGGVFGLIALKKEKKQQELALEGGETI